MMNLTPQSLRSPVSPYDQQSKQPFSSPRVCYTSSPQSHCASLRNAPSRGLGIFGCSIPSSQNAVHPLPPSPQPSDSWSHSSVMDQDYRQSSQHPDIFSSAFDPFSGFSTSSNTGMNLVNSPEAPGLDYCQTPPSSNMQSHRSSISSSYAPSDSYSQSGSDFMCTPKVKVEDASEWYPSAGNDQVLQRALSARELSSYPNSISPVNAQAADLYRSPPDGWSKSSVPTYTTELHGSPDCRLPRFDPHPILASVARTKKKRQRTTPEEATHECRVCGKLFKRSYNWKSHMETHNPERKYPHPCTAMIENTPCTKKFQRKTDLDRHYDSVHLKARNHQCNLCGNRFARRDTLRRHTEDGCPKRFELGFREGSEASPAQWALTHFPARNRSYSVGMAQSSPVVPPPSIVSSATFPIYNRPGFTANPASVPLGFSS